jgi:hypothetical protein
VSLNKLMMCSAFIAMVSAPVCAADIYAAAGAIYSQTEKPFDDKDVGSTFSVGYSINPQWSVELSYDQYNDAAARGPNSSTAANNGSKNQYNSKGVALSALGKTSFADNAVLFYRAGVTRQSVEEMLYRAGLSQQCPRLDAYRGTHILSDGVSPANNLNFTMCMWDGSVTQAMLGLGAEWTLASDWFVRTEALHLFSGKGQAISALKLSVGYRFAL